MLFKLSMRKNQPLQHLSVHYYTTNDKCNFLLSRSGSCSNEEKKKKKSVEEIAAYPANVGRNIAREVSRGIYSAIITIHDNSSRHNFIRMNEIAVRENITERKAVLVYRIFEIDESAESPKNKSDLSSLLSSNKAVVFHDRFYKGAHSIPGLDEWLKKEEGEGDGIAQGNLSMKDRSSWEPQFVSSSNIPLHDEAFPYMIRDNTCLRWELCRAGFSLLLVDDIFMFHREIKSAKEKKICGNTRQIQSTNIQRFYRALDAFKKRMDTEYPSTQEFCPEFRA
ncbi:hypothetical protein PMAYCL1PPCAC_13585 [Pristionchus mayeri]|uniref:Uncharacterized protein n=1 Tax=Pristionchus mayeri TaxID=1317129 RepID=A0AAN4ZTA7_9BILA|nr:hypothetical protein PMAYCL1PPCAC_13585 [Pristionchus mayeri]